MIEYFSTEAAGAVILWLYIVPGGIWLWGKAASEWTGGDRK